MSYNVERAFGYYDADEATVAVQDDFVDRFRVLAGEILAHVPENRERALALTNLEQAWQWVDSAFSTIGLEPAPEPEGPRVWLQIPAIPEGVSVTDSDGDSWSAAFLASIRANDTGLLIARLDSDWGPWTEVVEEAPAPRVWESVLDIPHGTLVDPAGYDGHLYITASGGGWYVDRGEIPSPGITGWSLDESENHNAPFTEVLG